MLDDGDIVFRQLDGAFAQLLTDKLLELFNTDIGVFGKVGHPLSGRFDPFADQLLVGRGDGPYQVFHIGIEQHGPVHDAFPGQVIECISRHFSSVYQDVVSARCFSRYAQFT